MQNIDVTKRVIILIAAILVAITSKSQPNSIEFDQYTTKEGLSNGYIISILHDSKGFIWIGTGNGLNRFNGITFENYYYDDKDSTTIPGSGINSIIEDSAGNIWIGAYQGLCVYNRKKDNFSRKRLIINNRLLPDFSVSSSFIDSKGFLWLSSYFGIIKINTNLLKESESIINAEIFYLDEPDVEKAFKHHNISIVEDNSGKIWASSFSKNLFFFDNEKKNFIPYSINHREANSFSNAIKTLIIDRDGDFFITMQGLGLLQWEKKKNVFTYYKPDGSNKSPKGSVLNAICEDNNGLIWMGDRSDEGLSIFDKKTATFTYCQQEGLNPYSLLTNKINTIYRDKHGAMWVGTIIGLNKYCPRKLKFNRYFNKGNLPGTLSSNNILCFEESKAGDIWIGTDGGGLNRFDRKTGKFTSSLNDPKNPESLSSNAINSICEDNDGTLWMGTYNGGLARMKNGKFSAFFPDKNKPGSISNRHIWYVLNDSKNNLWIATLNSGIDLFDRKSEQFYNYTNQENDSASLCNNTLLQLFEDSKQNLYVTTYGGVSIIDLNKCDFTKTPPVLHFRTISHLENANSLSNNNVYCVNEDHEGNIWFGTYGSGIDKMDSKTGEFTNFSTKDGLPGNTISSILFDEENNLWLTTDNGLAKFNPRTKQVLTFNLLDGLQNKNLKGRAIKTSDGEMFIGGSDGFNSFYPNQIKSKQNLLKPTVIITGLKIFNSPVTINQEINHHVILTSHISETREIALTYKEDFFSFEFVALDFTTPAKNRYAYKMEGFDEDWIYCGNKREANYTNLDPGTYTFRVKASNNDGMWNEEGATLKIVISPPWWTTWWFRLFVILAIISIITNYVFYRIRHFKNQKILLEKLVDKKTAELQQLNIELIKKTNDLIRSNEMLEVRQEEVETQSEELSAQKDTLEIMNCELNELNATKDKFFSIIAHDIKTPFNAIIGFSELLVENYNEWTDHVKLETIKIVLNSARNIYDLLDNLLQWSRAQRGNIEFNPEVIQLGNTFRNTVNLMKGNTEAKSIGIDIALPEKGVAVKADRQMLDTIIRNLVSNAIKFTPAGGHITLSAKEEASYAKIEIIDNGMGIQQKIKEKLFTIVSNQSTPGTNNESGTGLGLVITQDFVVRHGGSIGVESTVGKGSTFYFTLPLALNAMNNA